MNWYSMKKTASRPPAYIEERISDLEHAIELTKTSPQEARQAIARIIQNLSSQHDDEYVVALQGAADKMFDNPGSAREMMSSLTRAMLSDKRRKAIEDEEKGRSWMKSS